MDLELYIISRLYDHVGARAVLVGVSRMYDGCCICLRLPYPPLRPFTSPDTCSAARHCLNDIEESWMNVV